MTRKSNQTGGAATPEGTQREQLSGQRRPMRPPSLDPRSQSAVDNLGVDDQADLLDPALDDQPGDRNADGTSFLDDVRSDGDQDERNERR
jgi:hypothetical protein